MIIIIFHFLCGLKFRHLGVKMAKKIEWEDKGTVKKSKKGVEKEIVNSSLFSISIKITMANGCLSLRDCHRSC